MNIYFFSHYAPDPKMIEDLGGGITTRFKGTISNIHRQGNQIAFDETLFLGGQELKCHQTIPAKSVVVVEAPILQQEAWLNAGVDTLLIPQIQQEKGGWGSITSKYCGLVQVHRISVTKTVWHGCNSNTGGQIPQQESANPPETQLAQIPDSHEMQCETNLYRLLVGNLVKSIALH